MKYSVTIASIMLFGFLGGCENIGRGLQEAAEDTDSAAIWRGFEHKWDHEVHRTGRFGNWIEVSSEVRFPKTVDLNHAAQSGTNADSAQFNTHYDLIQATNTRFIPGEIHISDLDMEEGEVKRFERSVEIDISVANKLTGKTVLAAVINGFDLARKNGTAKKLGLLEIGISEPETVGNKIRFDIRGSVMLSCKSTECDVDEGAGPFRNDVHYTLTIYYLLAAGEEDYLNVVQHSFVGNSYDYDSAGDGVSESLGLFNRSLNQPLSSGFQTSNMGIRAFRFAVSKNTDAFFPDPVPHLFTWRMYGQHSGLLTGDLHMEGRAFFAHSRNGATNHPHQGEAAVQFKPVSMQFKVGLKKSCEWTENHSFPNNASTGASVQTKNGEIESKGNLICIESQL